MSGLARHLRGGPAGNGPNGLLRILISARYGPIDACCAPDFRTLRPRRCGHRCSPCPDRAGWSLPPERHSIARNRNGHGCPPAEADRGTVPVHGIVDAIEVRRPRRRSTVDAPTSCDPVTPWPVSPAANGVSADSVRATNGIVDDELHCGARSSSTSSEWRWIRTAVCREAALMPVGESSRRRVSLGDSGRRRHPPGSPREHGVPLSALS